MKRAPLAILAAAVAAGLALPAAAADEWMVRVRAVRIDTPRWRSRPTRST